MTADPEGSSTVRAWPGVVDPLRGATSLTASGWRGPGWRVFSASPGHGRHVRDWITRVVSRRGCSADPDDAALLVSELFVNALMHGPAGGRVLVGYCLWSGGARIIVCDAGGATTPRLRDPGEMEEGGGDCRSWTRSPRHGAASAPGAPRLSGSTWGSRSMRAPAMRHWHGCVPRLRPASSPQPRAGSWDLHPFLTLTGQSRSTVRKRRARRVRAHQPWPDLAARGALAVSRAG